LNISLLIFSCYLTSGRTTTKQRFESIIEKQTPLKDEFKQTEEIIMLFEAERKVMQVQSTAEDEDIAEQIEDQDELDDQDKLDDQENQEDNET